MAQILDSKDFQVSVIVIDDRGHQNRIKDRDRISCKSEYSFVDFYHSLSDLDFPSLSIVKVHAVENLSSNVYGLERFKWQENVVSNCLKFKWTRIQFILKKVTPNDECTLYIGPQGTGKSTLIGSRDGSTRGSTDSLAGTRGCVVSRDSVTNETLIDTRGFGDRIRSDDEIQRNIFLILKLYKIKKVKIVWTVRPESKRATDNHIIGARFIQKMSAKLAVCSEIGEVWKSVFIIAKEGRDSKSTKGAIGAAKHVSSDDSCCHWKNYRKDHSRPLTIFDEGEESEHDDDKNTSSDDSSEDPREFSYERRIQQGLLFFHGVGEWQRDLIAEIPSIQLSFEDKTCLKCGAFGDPREMSPYCHEDEWVHSGEIKFDARHRGNWQPNCLKRDADEIGISAVFGSFVSGGAVVVGDVGAATVAAGASAAGTAALIAGVGLAAGASVASGVSVIYHALKGDHVTGYWDCCGGKNPRDIRCKIHFQFYSKCGCERGRTVFECPSPSCSLCGVKRGSTRKEGSICQGRHHFA